MPVAITREGCPETLLLDRARLVVAQNELQRLSLVAAALLIAAQLLAMKRLPPGTSSPENRRSPRGHRSPPTTVPAPANQYSQGARCRGTSFQSTPLGQDTQHVK